MAPINPELQEVQETAKNVIQDLFQVLVQTSNYDLAGRPSRDPLAQDIITLDTSLRSISTTASTTLLSPRPQTNPPNPYTQPTTSTTHTPVTNDRAIPEPLIEYVEHGRNPDIYTREFVELVRRMNQYSRGKAHAFRDFRDVLAEGMRGDA
ncbi:RNA polymerase II mediator complex subunit [Collariella sp. IMI 366227]|nr:RNA polymerase II mediator complex subunit [Collariella sp. IMI 366227]